MLRPFPVSDQSRARAPLPWQPGTCVRIRERLWCVRRALRDRHTVRLEVENRSGHRTFLTPFDRPVAVGSAERSRQVRPQHALARLAGLIGRTESIRSLSSVIDGRLDILAYQLEPALAIVTGTRRLLVADDVGLGKTIQAAIVIAEIHRREVSARILLIVPAPLRAQWMQELSTRFNLSCIPADRGSLDAAAREGAWSGNPWRRAGIWLASIDFLKQPHVLEAMPLLPWDLVVIDEAHVVCGDSDRHQAADAIARRARRLLLLSATPHSGDEGRFGRLLDLGALAIEPDRLSILRRTRSDLSIRPTRRVRWHRVTLSDIENRALNVLSEYERAVLKHAASDRRDAALLLLSVFRKRALSTMHALAISIERRLACRLGRIGTEDWQQPRLNFDADSAAGEDDLGESEWRSLGADIGMNAGTELTWLRRLSGLAQEAARKESKVVAIDTLVRRTREPIVVFTEFRHSLQALQRRLHGRCAPAVLHGGQTQAEAACELERFLRGRASVLLATDVAAQGLNLQMRSRWVISFELPWNPMRLEQRAGRVDRIGQQRAARLTVLIARHQAEAGLLANLARKTLTARRALGDDVLPAVPDERQVREALLSPNASGRQDDDGDATTAHRQPISVCRKWVRLARAEAGHLTWRRALASKWRTRLADSQRPLRSTGGRLRTLCGNSTLVVLIVPLVDQRGMVVEQRIVPVRMETRAAIGRQWRERCETLSRLAARSAHGRAKRLAHLLTVRGGHDVAIEQAIAVTLTADCARVDQPGLFDRRSERALAAASEERKRIEHDLRHRIADQQNRGVIGPGKPTVAAILSPWR